jgi:hypothetical protein
VTAEVQACVVQLAEQWRTRTDKLVGQPWNQFVEHLLPPGDQRMDVTTLRNAAARDSVG